MAAHHGPFIWYEYASADPARAADFYSHVVGWTASDFSMPGMPYTVFNAPDTGVAGLSGLVEGSRRGWLGYVQVENVDETVSAFLAEGGGVLVPAMDIPTVGRFAILSDPGGAVLAVMTPLSEERWTPDGMAKPGHCGWHELYARDGEAAFPFYAKMFGWSEARTMDMGAMGVYRIFAQDGADIGGMMTMMPGNPAPYWNFYFHVDAIDAAAARAAEKGATPLMGPHQVPGGGWVIQMIDPDGNPFALLSAVK